MSFTILDLQAVDTPGLYVCRGCKTTPYVYQNNSLGDNCINFVNYEPFVPFCLLFDDAVESHDDTITFLRYTYNTPHSFFNRPRMTIRLQPAYISLFCKMEVAWNMWLLCWSKVRLVSGSVIVVSWLQFFLQTNVNMLHSYVSQGSDQDKTAGTLKGHLPMWQSCSATFNPPWVLELQPPLRMRCLHFFSDPPLILISVKSISNELNIT